MSYDRIHDVETHDSTLDSLRIGADGLCVIEFSELIAYPELDGLREEERWHEARVTIGGVRTCHLDGPWPDGAEVSRDITLERHGNQIPFSTLLTRTEIQRLEIKSVLGGRIVVEAEWAHLELGAFLRTGSIYEKSE